MKGETMLAEHVTAPCARQEQLQACCLELLGQLKGAHLDEGLAVLDWLRMKITRVNAIIMDNPVDVSSFPRVAG